MITSKLKKLINNADIVSFDVFDTLLLRPFVNPKDLFLYIEKKYNADGYCISRVNSELNARNSLTDGRQEVTLEEIYKHIDLRFSKFKSIEIDEELNLLYANPLAKEIYDYCLLKKKRIIVISDMYLSKKVISKALIKNGFNINDLFISSDFDSKKDTCGLFQIVKSKYENSRILHIGDNFRSDVKLAKKSGLFSYHLKSPMTSVFKDFRIKQYYKNHNSLFSSIIVSLVAYYNLTHSNESYWHKLGYCYAGPIIFFFAKWIEKNAREDNISQLFFIARDGYTLKKVFEVITNKTINDYVYANRKISNLISVNIPKNKDENYKLWSSSVKTLLSHYVPNYIIDDRYNPEEGFLYLQKNISTIEKLAENKKNDYKKFLDSIVKKQKIGIVDSGSEKLTSLRFITSMLPSIKCTGYYFFTTTSEKYGCDVKTYQSTHNYLLADWDIMEFFLSSPEPPIDDFINGHPVYKKCPEQEEYKLKIYPQLSEGCVLFAKKYIELTNNLNFIFDAVDSIDWLNSFLTIPTKKEKKYISRIRHTFDLDDSVYVPICKPWFESKFKHKIKMVIKMAVHKANFVSYDKFGKKIFTIKFKNGYKYFCFLGLPVFRKRN